MLHQNFTQIASETIGVVDGIVYSVNFIMIRPVAEQSKPRHARHLGKCWHVGMATVEDSDKYTQFRT